MEIQTTDDRLIEKLTQFRLEDAHCFDPNDEAKIRAAIAAGEGGAARFEEVIRSLGRRLLSSSTTAMAEEDSTISSSRKLSIESSATGGEVLNPILSVVSSIGCESGEAEAGDVVWENVI